MRSRNRLRRERSSTHRDDEHHPLRHQIRNIERSYRRSGSTELPKIAVSWSDQDHLALAQLIEKARQAHENLLDTIRSTPGFSALSPRQQAKLYAAEARKSPFASLMQLARLEKLDMESARRLLKNPDMVHEMLANKPRQVPPG